MYLQCFYITVCAVLNKLEMSQMNYFLSNAFQAAQMRHKWFMVCSKHE